MQCTPWGTVLTAEREPEYVFTFTLNYSYSKRVHMRVHGLAYAMLLHMGKRLASVH